MELANDLDQARAAWAAATEGADQACGAATAAYTELRAALAAEIGVCVAVLEQR
ncbi:MAG TPA: hypothetical protein VM677_10965 [Actinokineospora sp.]|jgi:hypothetical protein|nr:hypothetical protein [Actinokineospora sp.]